MSRQDIASACGYGNSSTAGIDTSLDLLVAQELTNTPYWFAIAAGTPTEQNPATLASSVPLSSSSTPLRVYRDPDNFIALVTADLTFENCHPKFQEFVGWKLIVQLLLEQGWTTEDLTEQTKKLTSCLEDLGKLHIGLRNISCTREVAKLRNRVAQYAGVPSMNDYSEVSQGWQIEKQLLETLQNDAILLAKRDTNGELFPWVAEYVVLKTASQLKPDEGMQARYKQVREDLVNWQAKLGRVKHKYLTIGCYFNTFWGDLNNQDPTALAVANGNLPILLAVRDPDGNLSKITVDTPWDSIPGMLQSLILMEEQLEDRSIRNSNSPVMQSEAILFSQRLKDWRKENDDKLSPPKPKLAIGLCRNKALMHLNRQKEGEFCATQDAYSIETQIRSMASQLLVELDLTQSPPRTYDPLWNWLAWEAAWTIAPGEIAPQTRTSAINMMHRWMNKNHTRNTAYDLNTYIFYA